MQGMKDITKKKSFENNLSSRKKRYKGVPILDRRIKVRNLWIYGFKIHEIASICKVSERTINNDILEIKKEIADRPDRFRGLRDRMMLILLQIIKEMKLEQMKVKTPYRRFIMLRKMADIPLEIWKKLVPDKLHLERPRDATPMPVDVFNKMTEEMRKRAPNYNEEYGSSDKRDV